MREIKFRGKRVDDGEWVYGCFAEFVNYLDGDTKPGIQVTNQVPSGFDRMIPAFETELVEVIPETVGQYTGLKDRNGAEIYEGDIASVTDQDGEYTCSDCGVGKVEYLKEFGFYNVSNIENSIHELIFQDYVVEVIGNIHDNPELMEDGEMTKQEFENALRRSVEAMLDGGQPGIGDILLISKALGGAELELMDKYERDTYLFGAQAGYMLGIGKSWQARLWEDED